MSDKTLKYGILPIIIGLAISQVKVTARDRVPARSLEVWLATTTPHNCVTGDLRCVANPMVTANQDVDLTVTGVNEWCKTSQFSVLVMKLKNGDRVVFKLWREGYTLKGMAEAWRANGATAGRGPVTGRFGGASERVAEGGFELRVYWHPPLSGTSDFSGIIKRGIGRGTAHDHREYYQEPVEISTSSSCARWPQEYYRLSDGSGGRLPAPRGTCSYGYVWREAARWDRICVLPDARSRVAEENQSAPSRSEQTQWGDPRLPKCKLGFFGRSAYSGDMVCVPLASAQLAANENALASQHTVNEPDGTDMPEQFAYCRGYADQAVADAEKNKTFSCEGGGSRWTTDRTVHLNWCMATMVQHGKGESIRAAKSETSARKLGLFRCERERQKVVTEMNIKPLPIPPRVNDPIRRGTRSIGKTPSPQSYMCKAGFVWREARPSDRVCVTPESRSRVAIENRTAGVRRDPNGASGSASCKQGFVWREAFDGDTVCVIPAVRAIVGEENRAAASRVNRQ